MISPNSEWGTNLRIKRPRDDLLYPDLSYDIIGCAYEVHNSLGGGHHEKVYQQSFEKELVYRGIKFQREAHYGVRYRGEIVGRNFIDFVIENKVVVEMKKGSRFSRKHIQQVLQYLEVSNTKLAILINFGTDKVRFKRVINHS